MANNLDKCEELSGRLDRLGKIQEEIRKEIDRLRTEISELKATASVVVGPDLTEVEVEKAIEVPFIAPAEAQPARQPVEHRVIEKPGGPGLTNRKDFRTNLEKFIGENLVNKTGIAVLVIGVGIGVKYAIDHDLISPWTRIILGYLTGILLFGFAAWLRKKYSNFSAVLLSGAMAILYFITFAAFNFYSLIPLSLAFALMAFFTLFTVAAAVSYNREVIALIGMVGAYAVPFLLDDGSGRVSVMFGYMAIINTGILAISFMKRWKLLYYSAFGLTWLIFLTWFITEYQPGEHFSLAMTFSVIFFLIFYIVFLAFKPGRSEKADAVDIMLLLLNSAFLYGTGYSILNRDIQGVEFRGLFTLINALLQAAVAMVLWRRKPADRNLVNFVAGVAVTFVAIAIPVQMDGRWVTLLWAGEAAVLFWIGRTRGAKVYELLSYPMMILVFFSLIHDWSTVYKSYDPLVPGSRIIPLFNINFLASLLVIGALAFINRISFNKKHLSPLAGLNVLTGLMQFAVMPVLLILVTYLAFIMEINTFWTQLYTDSMVTTNLDQTIPQHFWNEDIRRYQTLSVINFSLLFFAVLSLVNIRAMKEPLPGMISLVLNAIGLGVFLTVGLYALGELRESYLARDVTGYYYRGGFLIGIRYISFVFAGLAVWAIHRIVCRDIIYGDFRKEFDLLLHITLLTLAANELINWMDLYQPGQSYKLGLSLLFGGYALVMIILGILQKKFHLRIGALVLFAATLLKLLLYDIAYLNTISKTIVFVTLGVLLLVSSFLYTRYRRQIFGDRGDKPSE